MVKEKSKPSKSSDDDKKIKNKKGMCAMHSIQSIFVRVGTLQM